MENKKYALLIDADNISANYIGYILKEIIEKHGVITYKRIYGDWTSPHAGKWKEKLLEYSITPIQQFSNVSGKNASDSALIIDAMDILYADNVEGFCLVSSDSDFTRLATRLRESGMTVVGMGEEKTPRSFRTACSIFTGLEVLRELDKPEPEEGVVEVLRDLSQEHISKEIEYIIIEDQENGNEKGTVLSEIGSRLLNKYPEFDVRKYGYSLLSKFLEEMPQFISEKSNNRISIYMANSENYKSEVFTYIIECVKLNQGRAYELAELGQKIHSKFLNFTTKDFGYSKLSKLIQNIPTLEVKNNENGVKAVYIKEEEIKKESIKKETVRKHTVKRGTGKKLAVQKTPPTQK